MAGSNRDNGRYSNRNTSNIISDMTAMKQQIEDMVKQQKTASDMLNVAAGNLSTSVTKWADINSMMSENFGQGGVGTGFQFPPSPAGQQFRAPANQTSRPNGPSRNSSGSSHDNSNVAKTHGHGLAGIRHMAALGVHNKVGIPSGSTFTPRYDDSGNITHYDEQTKSGDKVKRSPNDPSLGSDIKAAAIRQGVSKVAANVASNGILKGVAGSSAAIGLPVMAATATYETAKIIGEQRQANAQYQSIYGGTNTQAMGQRLQEKGFELKNLFTGGLTSSQSAQAFQGVSALGYQGQARDKDLDFVTSNYKKLGMSVSDSLNLITAASKGLNEQLSGLKDGLDGATTAAKASGMSAQTARQNYANLYSNVSSTNPGEGTGVLTASLNNQLTQMGRFMQGANVSGMFTPGQLAIGAAGAGQTPTQWRATIQSNPQAFAQSTDARMKAAIGNSINPQVQAYVQSKIQAQFGNKTPPAADLNAFLQNLVTNDPQLGALGLNGQSLQASIQGQTGTTFQTPEQAEAFALSFASGNTTSSQLAAINKDKQETQKTVITGGSGGPKGTAGKLKQVAVDPVLSDAKSQLKGQNVIVQTGSGQRVVSIDEAVKDYPDQVAKGTAKVASTGASITDALGGESESNYGQFGGIKDTTTSKVNTKNTDRNKKGGQSLTDYQNDTGKNGGAANSGNAGTVTIAPSAQLQQFFQFIPTGNVGVSYNSAAASGVPLAPPGG